MKKRKETKETLNKFKYYICIVCFIMIYPRFIEQNVNTHWLNSKTELVFQFILYIFEKSESKKLERMNPLKKTCSTYKDVNHWKLLGTNFGPTIK